VDPVTRRKFLSRGTIAIGGAILAGWVAPAVAYVLSPARKRSQGTQAIALGSTDRVELGTPTLFKANVVRTQAWESTEEEISVYVVTEDGRTFKGLSNVCTHLGCRVRYVEDENGFFCPCHNAVFSKTGDVVSGPPPAPLEEFQLSVADGQLFVEIEV
jgi:Rieske Fe-S protein